MKLAPTITNALGFVQSCVLLLALSCGETRHEKHYATEYFIHGDPMVLVAGTQQDKKNFITTDNYSEFNSYNLVGQILYSEKTDKTKVKQIRSQMDLEEANSTQKEAPNDSVAPGRYHFQQSEPGMFTYISDNQSGRSLAFKASPDGLHLVRVGALKAEAVHYSHTEDFTYFSILALVKGNFGKQLMAFYFLRQDKPPALIFRRSNYPYLKGEGVAVGWQDRLDLSICGAKALSREEVYRASIDAWSAIGKDKSKIGSLAYEITAQAEPAPFSDVNQNCIFAIDGYRAEDQEGLEVRGHTLAIFDPSGPAIIHANALIFNQNIDPGAQTHPVVMHEVGHILGLGHEFSRNFAGEPLYDSIMGYNGVTDLHARDHHMILGLYPEDDEGVQTGFF